MRSGSEQRKRRRSRRSELRERGRGAGLRSCRCTDEIPVENFSYPRLPSLGAASRCGADFPRPGQDLVTANNRGGIVAHDFTSQLNIHKLQQGCLHQRDLEAKRINSTVVMASSQRRRSPMVSRFHGHMARRQSLQTLDSCRLGRTPASTSANQLVIRLLMRPPGLRTRRDARELVWRQAPPNREAG